MTAYLVEHPAAEQLAGAIEEDDLAGGAQDRHERADGIENP